MQRRKPEGFEMDAKARPSPGTWVAVFDGPQVGVCGFVRRHVRSKFSGAAPAGGDDGRTGYRVEIDAGEGKAVWVAADKVDVFVRRIHRRNRYLR